MCGVDVGMPFEGILKDLLLNLPFSRRCETEADYIGLVLMARACYDPRAAVSVWQRMSKAEGALAAVPAFLSTHPASRTRVEQLRKWLPEAEREYEKSGCPDIFYSLR